MCKIEELCAWSCACRWGRARSGRWWRWSRGPTHSSLGPGSRTFWNVDKILYQHKNILSTQKIFSFHSSLSTTWFSYQRTKDKGGYPDSTFHYFMHSIIKVSCGWWIMSWHGCNDVMATMYSVCIMCSAVMRYHYCNFDPLKCTDYWFSDLSVRTHWRCVVTQLQYFYAVCWMLRRSFLTSEKIFIMGIL